MKVPLRRERAGAAAKPAAGAAAAILSALSAVHVYWALGGKCLSGAAVPARDNMPLFEPSTRATWTVAGALATAAGVVLATPYAGRRAPRRILLAGTLAVTLAFLARAVGEFKYIGLFKRIKGTPFAERDTRVYVPLCLLIAALGGITALTSRGNDPARPMQSCADARIQPSRCGAISNSPAA